MQDEIRWRWTSHGEYTSKSAYSVQFTGSFCRFDNQAIWKAPMEGNTSFFCMVSSLEQDPHYWQIGSKELAVQSCMPAMLYCSRECCSPVPVLPICFTGLGPGQGLDWWHSTTSRTWLLPRRLMEVLAARAAKGWKEIKSFNFNLCGLEFVEGKEPESVWGELFNTFAGPVLHQGGDVHPEEGTWGLECTLVFINVFHRFEAS
jgi:hypothetical protein